MTLTDQQRGAVGILVDSANISSAFMKTVRNLPIQRILAHNAPVSKARYIVLWLDVQLSHVQIRTHLLESAVSAVQAVNIITKSLIMVTFSRIPQIHVRTVLVLMDV